MILKIPECSHLCMHGTIDDGVDNDAAEIAESNSSYARLFVGRSRCLASLVEFVSWCKELLDTALTRKP